MFVLQFNIYAEGVGGLVGEEEDIEEGMELPEATAGLSLSLMDVLLRPVEFFRGSSGLMSAVWNAPSEPVSALQVSIVNTYCLNSSSNHCQHLLSSFL